MVAAECVYLYCDLESFRSVTVAGINSNKTPPPKTGLCGTVGYA